jgi:hypothetical protein
MVAAFDCGDARLRRCMQEVTRECWATPIINLREWQQLLPDQALPRSPAPIHVEKELVSAASVLPRAPKAGYGVAK